MITDTQNYRIRMVSPSGVITTVAGSMAGFGGDGSAAAQALLNFPQGPFIDASGTLFFADWANQRVRKISSTGTISTVAGSGAKGFAGDNGSALAASLNGPSGVAMDSSGNLFISDQSNNRIRKVSPGGVITTVAGNGTATFSGDNGPAASASINDPNGIAVDFSGNVLIPDSGNNRVRMVSAATGIITTVAGNGTKGFSGDGGPATAASLNYPAWVAVDGAGNLFIADMFNNRIRKVSTGIITTAAGSGPSGFPVTGDQRSRQH